MTNYAYFRHRNRTNVEAAAKKPTARDYGDGSMSIKKLATALGLRPFDYLQVQKALCRIGLLKYKGRVKPEVTELGAKYSREHEEIQNENELVSWTVWKPEVVEMLREPLVWILANPKANPLEGTEFQSPNTVGKTKGERAEGEAPAKHTYPDGFLSINGLAEKADVGVPFAVAMLLDWGIVKRTEKGKKTVLVPDDLTIKQDRARLHLTGKLDPEGNPETFGIFASDIAFDLRDEWSERLENLNAAVAAQNVGAAE